MKTAKTVLESLKSLGLLTSYKIERTSTEDSNHGTRYTKVEGKGEGLSISEETYGNKSFLYCWFNREDKDLYGRITSAICVCGGDYKPWNNGLIEIEISAIKGYHHWE